jgi:hypothetical protein
MNETLLKKEFKQSDVQRVRNLVNKNFTDRTKTLSGYTKTHIHYQEGDIWEEDGRRWTIKNGIKQNITKLDSVKDLNRIPLRCPKCGGSMSHWLAKKMYRIHGFCFDPCTVDYEAELRKAGLYEQYEKRMMEGNMKAFIKDIEEWVLDSVSAADTFVTEQGDIESWNNNSTSEKEKRLTKVKEFTQHLQNLLQKD